MTSIRHELRALLISPVTWAMATGYVIFSGIFFVVLLFSRGIADLESYYSNIETTLVVLAPIVAMRSFAEERRTGALDITLSWPTSRWWLVATKFVANTLLTWLIVSVVWLYIWLLNREVDVEVGKNGAGFIGLLMILLMFNAIALAVSARSRSPATAAFVGFGVLIALWVLDFVPGWLGGRFEAVISFVAPTNHVANSGRGILDLGDGLYFVAGMILGLSLAVLWLKEPRPRSLEGAIRGRFAGVLLGLVVTAGVGGASTVARGQVDLTPEKRFTLTDHSVFVLAAVTSPTTIYGFVEPGSAQQVEMRSLIRRYQLENHNIALEFVDPDAQPALTKSVGARTYGQMMVEMDGRRELVDDILEIEVTSALQRLAQIDPPLACFTVGHGERDVGDILPGGFLQFAEELRKLGFVVEPLALGAAGGLERLGACSVVVIAGAKVNFLPEEIELLRQYTEANGRLLVFADSKGAAATAQLNDLLRPWGVAVRDAVVADRSSLKDDPESIVAYRFPSASPVTVSLARDNIPVLLVAAQPVESALVGLAFEDQAWITPLVQSSSQSRLADGDEGPFVLALITDWSSVEQQPQGLEIARTRIGVVGTVEVAANGHFDRLGNGEFSTRLVSWVARQDDLISAMRPVRGVPRLVLTEDDRGGYIRNAIVFPALAAFALLLFTLRRSRAG
ncbi:MAG: ABC transporter permease subunit [Acidimicrobiia bacterium]|nr:Gldg family protein [bacterium]MXZ30047.1 ABC transporter permease subunit [Acidimicrobiia bacterium]MYB23505.1 ABC transporter permease subunit [Acidimicrobiia bacterium]MYE68356.1 ABC transporter permease subunit [Acidimicrobiia bacterium]